MRTHQRGGPRLARGRQPSAASASSIPRPATCGLHDKSVGNMIRRLRGSDRFALAGGAGGPRSTTVARWTRL